MEGDSIEPASTDIQVQRSDTLTPRSEVPDGLDYGKYRPYLQRDFSYSCAYCTMTEAEAAAISFAIDHYIPVIANPTLRNTYTNLMYCCDPCNSRKGDRLPPSEAFEQGIRFYKADQDYFTETFEIRFENGSYLIYGKNLTGEYTVEFLDLNRLALRRLREIRQRVYECAAFIERGVASLRSFPIDQLPLAFRAKAQNAIRQTLAMEDSAASAIENIIAQYAKSPLLEQDSEDHIHKKARQQKERELKALFPGGSWRGRGKR